jgi:hypothetical protein
VTHPGTDGEICLLALGLMTTSAEDAGPRFTRSQARSINLTFPRLPGIILRPSSDQEDQIMSELMAERGNPVDQGGYYHPDDGLTAALMRPSATLNAIIDG